MWILLLEVLLALCIFVFIVWWTMFSGRKGGELPDQEASVQPPHSDAQASTQAVGAPQEPVTTSDGV